MADNLIFPIGFDLQKAVEKAGQDWDKTYAKKLETYLAKRPIKVKLNFENLTDVKTRLAQLKIEPITPETRASIKELARELQVLAKALEQVQKYSKNPAQLGQQNFRNDVQLEKLRQANERLEIQKRRVALAEQKHAEAMKRSASASKQLSSEYQAQEGYVSRLVKRLAVYASFSAVSGLLTNIRQVTAEFELQRVSLGAIIQDQERANQLFGEIKSFALKSPVSILDLTKYTKQIAAYGVETEKLFDTTKMLTDVSVGLGTPLSQLALAFGQIRSSSALRLAETRQLTEAGIPALELLAKQLEKTYGRFVSTAEVMELISKRAISFEMVEQMFKDMTSAGGAFYNMQEKQGNTLFGLWAKLGDAASIMYDEIGNTSSVNSGMKEAIRLLSDLMRNWRNVGLVVAESAAVFAIWKLQAVNAALVTNALTAAEVRALAVKKVHYKMQPAIIRGIIGETNARKLSIITVRAHAAAVRASATSTNIFTKAWYSLKAAFLSNPFGIALTALAAIATYLMFADDKVKRFKEDLDSIREGGAVEATKSAYNFEQLAEKAVNAADGSMEQKDALDELQRTYKDMIPIQDLTIEKLKTLKGNYDSLTQSIKEYVYQRNLQQQIDRIIEERTGTMTRIEQKLRDEMKEGVKYQVSDAVHAKDLGIDDNQISALFSRIKTEAKNTTKDVQTIIRESVDEIFGYLSQEDRNILYYIGYNKLDASKPNLTDGYLNTLDNLVELQRAMDGEIENASTSMSQYTGYLGEYKKELDNITESVKKYRIVNTKGEAVGRDTFLFQQGQQNFKIKKWANSIKSDLENAGVTIQEGIFNLVDKINENDPTKISTIDFTKLMPMLDSPEVKQKLGNSYETFKNYVLSIQKLYDGIVPSDPIVQAVRNRMFAIGNATKGGMDVMKKHLWDGKGSIEDHLKTLKQSAATLESEIYKYSQYIKLFGTAGKTLLKMMGVDVDALSAEYDALTKQIAYVQQYVKETDKKDKGGSKSDPRLQTLHEIANKMAEVNKEYDELLKKEGQTKALADTQKLFASSFKQMEATAKKYGFKLPAFEVPQTIEDVQKWYKAVADEIKRLKLKNADKILIELGFKSDKAAIDKQQKDIEKQIKALVDRISRTKKAKEFYEKVLGMTGDYELAANIAVQLYGSNGKELGEQIKEQFRLAFATLDKPDVDVSAKIGDLIDKGRYEELRNYIALLPEAQRKAAEDLVKTQQQMSAKQYEQWLKDLEKAKDYADKRIELSRYTANQIAAIEERIAKLDPAATDYEQQKEMLQKLIDGYKSRERKEEAGLEYEQFKNSALYVQMFDDLDNASTTMLRNMKQRIEELKTSWKDLTPTQLKEMQSRLNEIDTQLAKRNPFKGLIDGIKEYRNLRKGGDTLGNKSEGAAEKALDAAAKARLEAEKEYLEILNKEGATQEEIAKAKERFDDAAADEDAAAKALEYWKKVKDAIGLSANVLFQMLNWAGDIAKGIADISEAMGADEEDVRYWNDVADALGQISGGIQDIVSAAMSGNVTGVISSTLTAIPKMFVGFTNLFSAGKIKRANKEIKRQQELLEQLEYTYGRLEKAAERAFGNDYISNYNQRMRVLRAEQEAYLKQAEAERSKGKKEDEAKTQEYMNRARDAADQIAEMQSQIAEQMTGTDVGSAAREFAQAWLEAYASFSSTSSALKEKFDDMIKSMVVESVMAKVVSDAMQPMFDEMNEMYKRGESMTSVLAYAMRRSSELASELDAGLRTAAAEVEAAGVSIRGLYSGGDGLKGISRDIATASEESITGLAQGVSTQNYYLSHVPQLAQNVAAMRTMMEAAVVRGGGAGVNGVDYTGLSAEAMGYLAAIERHTAETVAECRNIAARCEEEVGLLRRVIVPKGQRGAHGVQVWM